MGMGETYIRNLVVFNNYMLREKESLQQTSLTTDPKALRTTGAFGVVTELGVENL